MKHVRNVLRLLALLAASLPLVGSPAGAQTDSLDSEFMKEFRKAMGIHDRDEMARLVKKNVQTAVFAIIDTCDLISKAPSEKLETEIDALSKAWRKAFDTGFAVRQYEYFSLLSPEFKKHRKTLIDSYLPKYDSFVKASEAKDKGKLPQLGAEFESLSEEFERIGDLYMASACSWSAAECFDRKQNPDNPDLRRACSNYGRMLRLREEIELTVFMYPEIKERFEALEFEGYGDPSKGPEARAAERAAEDPSYAPHPLEGKFELVEDISAVARPSYLADEIFAIWFQVGMGEIGTTGEFTMIETRAKMLREAAAKIVLDADGDGAGDVEVPTTGKPKAVEVEIDGRKWGFIATIGSDKETYQGIQPFNLGTSKESFGVYIAPAASIVGMIGETRIQIFDDNMDGKYGGEPKTWVGLAGLREGATQYEVDSILVGDAKRAIPFSKYVKVGDDWYQFEPTEDGLDVIVAKTEVETGNLELDMKGVSADFVVLRGSGNNEDVYVDVAASKRVEVPVGSYSLLTGRISKGKGSQVMKAMLVPATNTPSWRAAAGSTTAVELGAPFKFDFSIEQDDTTVTVKGKSVVVVGRGNETYQRLWNCVPRPEASERKEGSKKGGKAEKMEPLLDQQLMVNEYDNDWQLLWFPLSVTLEKKKEGEPSEVQLVEKKNKLFGKIESDWKGI